MPSPDYSRSRVNTLGLHLRLKKPFRTAIHTLGQQIVHGLWIPLQASSIQTLHELLDTAHLDDLRAGARESPRDCEEGFRTGGSVEALATGRWSAPKIPKGREAEANADRVSRQ